MADNDSSDEKLRMAVVETLAANDQTGPLNLRVGVMNAVAHLAGYAPSMILWKLAEQIAAQVPGVRGVVNRIEAPGAPSPARTIHLDLPPNASLEEVTTKKQSRGPNENNKDVQEA